MIEQATRNPNTSDAQSGSHGAVHSETAAFARRDAVSGSVVQRDRRRDPADDLLDLMGGAATFKQVYSVVAHSGVVSSLSGLLKPD